ncbi:MAG TPA: hypothetical protein VFE62_01645 [Gemmataceae bacterium]|nr:hypothetical protein [Gemmataceae bacterium]
MKPITGSMFFNAEEVVKKIDAKKRRVLSMIGAYTRTTARQSIKPAKIANRKEIRRAKKLGQQTPEPEYIPSRPGEPPRTRRPDQPIKKILFGYDADGGDGEGSLVVGFGLAFGSQTGTPLRLEKGGSIRIRKTGRIVRTAARPTLAPALAKEQAKVTTLFSGEL